MLAADDENGRNAATPQARRAGAWCLVILAGVAAFIGWGLWKAMTPSPVPLQGMMDARTVSVAAKVAGRLGAVKVEEGSVVKAGDVVAELLVPEIEAKVAQAKAAEAAAKAQASLAEEGSRAQAMEAAKADVARAEAAADLAAKTYERVAALFADRLVSVQKRDEARAQKANAENQAQAARAKLSAVMEGARAQEKAAANAMAQKAAGAVAEASSLAREAAICTPAAGEVTRVVMHEGEVVPAGFPVALVTDIENAWAVFNVREDELKNIKKGAGIDVFVPALEKTIPMTVYWINPRGDYAVWRATRQSSGYDIRTFEVRARPAAPVADLRPGMTVVVKR